MTMKDCISHLSEEIGARPVGTDEEQAAAFYIKEQFDKQQNLEAEIQEFKCSMNPGIPRVAESVFCALSAIIAVVSSAFIIPSAIIAVVCGILFVLDYFDVFTLSSFLGNAPSQNVVAKYKPSTEKTGGRSKKVVLITNYDSEKVRAERTTFRGIAKFLPYIELGGVTLTILVMLLSLIAGANAFFNVLLVVAAILCLILPLLFVLQQTGPYNAAANCNAASVAVMLDVAEKFNSEIVQPVTPRQYGRQVAEEEGVIPENVQVEWEGDTSSQNSTQEPATQPSEELLTGETQAFEHIDIDSTSQDANISAERSAIGQALPDTDLQSSLNNENVSVASPETPEMQFNQATQLSFSETPKKSSTPDWFTQAKKDAAANSSTETKETDIKRSVFADALEQANNPVAPEVASEQNNAGKSDLEKQLEIIHAQINAEGEQALKNNAELTKEAISEVDSLHDAAVAFESAPIEEKPDPDITLREVEAPQPAENAMPETVKPEVNTTTPVHNSLFASIPSVSEVEVTDNSLANANKSESLERPNRTEDRIVVPATELETTVIEPVSDTTQKLTKDEVNIVSNKQIPSASKTPTADVPAMKNEGLSVPVINRAKPKKREISLPSLTSAIEADKVAHELQKKTDAENERIKAESKNIKSDDEILPSGVVKHTASNDDSKMSNLSSSLPSLNSNAVTPKKEDSTVAVAGAFNVGDATGTFAPIGDELIAGKSESEIYVDDVDDSDYGTNITETGAMAGPDMVDIPDTRAESVFGKMFHRKKRNKSSDSFSAGIGVDENFDAREVGKNRGDWSSFADDDEWEGGMFSKAKEKLAGGTDDIDYDAEYVDHAVSFDNESSQESFLEEGASEPVSRKRHTSFGELLAKSHISVSDTADREEVYNFAVGAVPYDVWCVALGAENADHAGLKAFLAENEEDLKGATFVVMNGLGAGELSLVKGDGKFKKSNIPPRLKRYAKSAAKKLQIRLDDCDLQGRETTSSYLSDKGFSTLHLAGIEEGEIAYDSTKDDTIDVVDELRLTESSEFISQFLREF